MKYLLFGIFVLVPIAEIATFIHVGDIIGLWPTIAIVILTAFFGTGLLRFQGMATLARAQSSLNSGELPLESVIHGVFLLIAGLLLLTPGFLTDFVGFLLFIPPVRLAIAHWALQKLKHAKNVHVHQTGTAKNPESSRIPPVIEGEFTIADDEPKARPQSKPGSQKSSGNGSSPDSPWKQ